MSKLIVLCALHALIVRPLNLNKTIKKCGVIKRDVPCKPVCVAEIGAQPTAKVDGMGQGVSGKSGGVWEPGMHRTHKLFTVACTRVPGGTWPEVGLQGVAGASARGQLQKQATGQHLPPHHSLCSPSGQESVHSRNSPILPQPRQWAYIPNNMLLRKAPEASC